MSISYNKREVVLRCVQKIREFFDIEKWQINQPIEKSDLVYDISLVEGVRSVLDVNIINKYKSEDGYSGNVLQYFRILTCVQIVFYVE